MEGDKPTIDRKSIKFMQRKNLGNWKVIGGALLWEPCYIFIYLCFDEKSVTLLIIGKQSI